jgi:hypothetical protein
MPANKRYLPPPWLLGCRSWASDGSVLEASGRARDGCPMVPWPRAASVCPARAPSQGGGAPGLTAIYAHRSGDETQAEDLYLAAAEVQTLEGVDFAIVAAQAVESAARPGRGQASQTTRAACGTGLRYSSMYPSVSPQGEAGGDEADAKAPRQVKHDRGWSESLMSNTNRSRSNTAAAPLDDRAPPTGGPVCPHTRNPSHPAVGNVCLRRSDAHPCGYGEGGGVDHHSPKAGGRRCRRSLRGR